jgi:hypothetical protein
VLGIAGFIVCPLVAHIAGLILANQSLRAIAASGGTLGGEGLAQAGKWLSIIGLVLSALAIVGTLLFFLLFAGAVSVSEVSGGTLST